MADAWSFRRSVFRAYEDELRRIGLLAEVRARASPRLAALLDDPGSRPGWIEPGPFDEIAAAIQARRGPQGLRELGRNVMQRNFAVLQPIIHFSLEFVGGSPASLYARAQSLLDVLCRGVTMSWLPAGDRGGTIRVRCAAQVVPAHWVTWEGVFGYGLEVAGATGEVAPARRLPDGRGCDIDIRWR